MRAMWTQPTAADGPVQHLLAMVINLAGWWLCRRFVCLFQPNISSEQGLIRWGSNIEYWISILRHCLFHWPRNTFSSHTSYSSLTLEWLISANDRQTKEHWQVYFYTIYTVHMCVYGIIFLSLSNINNKHCISLSLMCSYCQFIIQLIAPNIYYSVYTTSIVEGLKNSGPSLFYEIKYVCFQAFGWLVDLMSLYAQGNGEK